MKTIIPILLYLAISLTACKKNNQVLNKLPITGTWELRATRGGNIIPATYAPGNGHLISFGNTAFATYTGGVLEASGSYQQHTDGSGHDTLIYDNNIIHKDIATMKNDTLILEPFDFPDGATSYYIKSSNGTSLN
jgi:hypothetical protein